MSVVSQNLMSQLAPFSYLFIHKLPSKRLLAVLTALEKQIMQSLSDDTCLNFNSFIKIETSRFAMRITTPPLFNRYRRNNSFVSKLVLTALSCHTSFLQKGFFNGHLLFVIDRFFVEKPDFFMGFDNLETHTLTNCVCQTIGVSDSPEFASFVYRFFPSNENKIVTHVIPVGVPYEVPLFNEKSANLLLPSVTPADSDDPVYPPFPSVNCLIEALSSDRNPLEIDANLRRSVSFFNEYTCSNTTPHPNSHHSSVVYVTATLIAPYTVTFVLSAPLVHRNDSLNRSFAVAIGDAVKRLIQQDSILLSSTETLCFVHLYNPHFASRKQQKDLDNVSFHQLFFSITPYVDIPCTLPCFSLLNTKIPSASHLILTTTSYLYSHFLEFLAP